MKKTSKTPAKAASARGDVREIREESSTREDRELQERTHTQDNELSDEVRLEMVRGGGQSILPTLPEIPGYKNVWLSTTNSNDPIHRRMQLGWSPIKASEVPSFGFSSIKSGEWQGCVGVNEMLAFKIPNDKFDMYMKELHYHAPNREEEGINAIYEQAQAQAAQVNSSAQELLTDEGRVRRDLSIPEPSFL